MFDHDFLKILSDDLKKIEEFDLDYAKHIIGIFSLISRLVQSNRLPQIENFFIVVQLTIIVLIENIST